MCLIKPKKAEKSRKVVKRVEKSEYSTENAEIDPFTRKITVLVDKAAIDGDLTVKMLVYLLSGEG